LVKTGPDNNTIGLTKTDKLVWQRPTEEMKLTGPVSDPTCMWFIAKSRDPEDQFVHQMRKRFTY
jgi:hypothetical protein